jgi:glutamate racemase
VLGCTHYPFVKHVIQEIVGQDSNQKHITLIDTGAAVAKQLKRQLEEKGLLSTSQEKAEVHFWTNSEAENASQVTEKLWGNHVDERRL